MAIKWSAVALAASSLALTGCAGEIDHFSSRIISVNESIARADADNIVRNAVRASLNEPLTFVAVSKVTNGRQSDLKLGLPTITFGPAQTAGQKQFVFSGNVTDNSESYSVEMAQLRTDTFTKGVLTPVDPVQMENYSQQGFSRELLYYLFLQKISIKIGSGDHPQVYVFENNPALDDVNCPEIQSGAHTKAEGLAGVEPDKAAANANYANYDPIALAGKSAPTNLQKCRFHEFQYLVDLSLNYGVSFRAGTKDPQPQNYKVALTVNGGSHPSTQPVPPADQPKEADTPKSAAFSMCFDKGLANPILQSSLRDEEFCKDKSEGRELDVPDGSGKTGMTVTVTFRSPYAMLQYLGSVARLPESCGANRCITQPVMSISPTPVANADRHLFPIFEGSDQCYLSSEYETYPYCVPTNAYDAKAAINVLMLLLQENTNRTDLPSSAVSVQF